MPAVREKSIQPVYGMCDDPFEDVLEIQGDVTERSAISRLPERAISTMSISKACWR